MTDQQVNPDDTYLDLNECNCGTPEIAVHTITGTKICIDCNPFYDKECKRCGSKRYDCVC